GRDGDAVELGEPVGRRLVALQEPVERRDALARARGLGGRAPGMARELEIERLALLLRRLDDEGEEKRRHDQNTDGAGAEQPELLAQPQQVERHAVSHFSSCHAAEMAKPTGRCGSSFFTSWRTSCTLASVPA